MCPPHMYVSPTHIWIYHGELVKPFVRSIVYFVYELTEKLYPVSRTDNLFYLIPFLTPPSLIPITNLHIF